MVIGEVGVIQRHVAVGRCIQTSPGTAAPGEFEVTQRKVTVVSVDDVGATRAALNACCRRTGDDTSTVVAAGNGDVLAGNSEILKIYAPGNLHSIAIDRRVDGLLDGAVRAGTPVEAHAHHPANFVRPHIVGGGRRV